MEITKSLYTDLIFHVFAHMKIDNASDIYDEAYIDNIEEELGRKTTIPEGVTDYYCANFERLAFINFLPYFMVKNVDELCYMISHTGMTTDEDMDRFINPFCGVLREIATDYVKYWCQKENEHTAAFEELQKYISKQASVLNRFFEKLHETTNMKIKIIISDGLRKNGRATGMGDTFVVILPTPSETYSMLEIFMQYVHECTHMFTDQLLDSIHMDDGSHDIAEYQVTLFDLWLFKKYFGELCCEYIKWVSQEFLDECDRNLCAEQKSLLKNCFDSI